MYYETPGDALYELSLIEIPRKTIEDALTLPKHFGLRADNREDYKQPGATWSLGSVILCRDSSALERSNAEVLEADLHRLTDMGVIRAEDWDIVKCNHWAVGWVNHVTFRALDEDGVPTLVFRFLEAWFESLRDGWPVADDAHYANLQFADFSDALMRDYSHLTNEEAPGDWFEHLAHELLPGAEPDHHGDLWVREEEVTTALRAHGWLDEEE